MKNYPFEIAIAAHAAIPGDVNDVLASLQTPMISRAASIEGAAMMIYAFDDERAAALFADRFGGHRIDDNDL